ncbi:T9SS type A sorting domain-containing protein, partial [bacterium]|nr:T9SS type A sorting domain-containing protein [bacterium]
DTVSDTNLPFSSSLTLIKNYGDSLDSTKIYPNPWNKDLNCDQITFAQLTENVTIKIYTIAGKLVLESDANGQSEWEWDMKNERGKDIASGIYICYISNDKGEKKIGKIAIIR